MLSPLDSLHNDLHTASHIFCVFCEYDMGVMISTVSVFLSGQSWSDHPLHHKIILVMHCGLRQLPCCHRW